MVKKDRRKSCKKITLLRISFSDKTINEITMRRPLKRLGFRGRAASEKTSAEYRSSRRKWSQGGSARTTTERYTRVVPMSASFHRVRIAELGCTGGKMSAHYLGNQLWSGVQFLPMQEKFCISVQTDAILLHT